VILLSTLLVVGLALWWLLAREEKPPGLTDERRPESARKNEETSSRGEKPSGLTDEQCLAFAHELEKAINAGDFAFFDRSFDVNELTSRAIEGLGGSRDLERGFRKGAVERFREGGLFSEKIRQALGDYGSYSLLRIRRKEGGPRALFRMTDGEGSLNYHDLILVQDRSGRVKIGDIYLYAAGETLSHMLRRSYISMRSLADGHTGPKSDFAAHITELSAMRLHVESGRYDAALAVYRRLPASLRREKIVLIVRLHCVAGQFDEPGGEKRYLDLLSDFRKYHPGDPCLDLVLLDFYFLREEHEKAFQCIERLDESLGGDPYLQYYRGGVRLEQERLEEAKAFYNRALEQEPTLLDAYYGLVAVALTEKDFGEVARLLDVLEDEFGVEFGDLREESDYAEFLRSEEGRRWFRRWAQGE